MNVQEKLQALRQKMEQHDLYAWIIPSSDPHQSEYVAERWQTRKWISGFTGSAGTVVITRDKAGLWTDSRYFLQAETQLQGSTIKLFKMGMPEVPSFMDWLVQEVPSQAAIGFEAEVFSVATVRQMEQKFATHQIRIQYIPGLIDELWTDRPQAPMASIYELPLDFSGETRTSKLERVRQEMQKHQTNAYLISSLDDIAWLYNYRGEDVHCSPVAVAHTLILEKSATFFIETSKVPAGLQQTFNQEGIDIQPYKNVENALKQLPDTTRLLLDPAKTNQELFNHIPQSVKVIEKPNLTTAMKTVKNATEIAGMKAAHVRDGVAMVKFLHWLTKHIGKEEITEISASDKLEQFRSEQDHFKGISFDTIAGYRAHGAIIHYKSTPETDVALHPEGMFLLDSGGHYLDGTTDITRTIALGAPTAEQKRNFTLVLKGHIALSRLQFPQGLSGVHIDSFAKAPLWEYGLDYRHGTGHGVGAFLNVHEGPQSISAAVRNVPLQPGMCTTNEPGFYQDGEYGIRIENILLTIATQQTEYGQFLGFEAITMCPIDRQLIDTELLLTAEKEWLNTYHQTVYERLSPSLTEAEKQWLHDQTRPL